MRKQTKIAAIVSAAALLALGASITSFAAVRGTWRIEDGEWKCYDKNGEAYENVFAVSNGKEYYVGDDGLLVRSDWVEYEGSYYFVNSAGAKITSDWRLTTPYDEPDEEEEWYYFQSSGKRAENKKITWKNNTYYFDGEGKMLTGWVTSTGNDNVDESNTFVQSSTYYCDEDGARVKSDWRKATTPETRDDEDADTYWYYFDTNGRAVTGKKNNIKGQTYFFNENGQMLSGWVSSEGATGSDVTYIQIDKEDAESSIASRVGEDVYYCGPSSDGHAKKNKWVKLWAPEKKADEEEDDLRWFWFDKNGKVYRTTGGATNTENKLATAYTFVDGLLKVDKEASSDTQNDGEVYVSTKKVNSKDYWFNSEGEMVSGFYMMPVAKDTDGTPKDYRMFYFGGADDGSMKTGSQSIKDDAGDVYKFYFETSSASHKGAGITGNKSNKLYYFGRLVTAGDYKYQIVMLTAGQLKLDTAKYDPTDEFKFIINSNGSIQHSKSQYKEDGDVLIDARTLTDAKKYDKEDLYGQEITFSEDAGVTKYSIVEKHSATSGKPYNYVEEIDLGNFIE